MEIAYTGTTIMGEIWEVEIVAGKEAVKHEP